MNSTLKQPIWTDWDNPLGFTRWTLSIWSNRIGCQVHLQTENEAGQDDYDSNPTTKVLMPSLQDNFCTLDWVMYHSAFENTLLEIFLCSLVGCFVRVTPPEFALNLCWRKFVSLKTKFEIAHNVTGVQLFGSYFLADFASPSFCLCLLTNLLVCHNPRFFFLFPVDDKEFVWVKLS